MSLAREGFGRLWVLSLLVAAAGCFDAVVGYPCAGGLSACGSSCVNLQASVDNCGACGNPCEGRCAEGLCLPPVDGGEADAGLDAGTDATPGRPDSRLDTGIDRPADAPGPDTAGPDTAAPDTAAPDTAPPDASPDAPAPVPDASPPDTPEPDAAPDLPPDGPPPDTAPPLSCDGSFQICGARCVRTEEDPDHCGRCGNRCSSGLCVASVCQSQGVGHLVVIGHDYIENRPGMNTLLGNAVLLAPTSPTAVLVYEGEAAPEAITGPDSAIDQVTGSRGRGWMRTVATADQVVARLPDHDVFLIYAQESTDDNALAQLGQDWAAALAAFLASGKTIVLLDGDTDEHSGTYQILEAAGLFSAAARVPVTGEMLTVTLPGDAVALNVPRGYLAEVTSVAYDTQEDARVVETATDLAVVIHRVF